VVDVTLTAVLAPLIERSGWIYEVDIKRLVHSNQ
jgi:hypothetical protein